VNANAISFRHDVAADSYIVEEADFPAVVDLWPGDCSATLIRPDALITVAHCASDIRLPMALTISGLERPIRSVALHPDYRGWADDIAIIFLEDSVTDVMPHDLYRDTDELGQTLTLVGRGLHSTGLVGERGGDMDLQLRRAQNVVTRTSDQWLEVVFEGPDDGDVLPLEGVGLAGDSGGPAFIETPTGLALAGLNSWGDAPAVRDIGTYDSWDYSTRISVHLEWIDAVLGGPALPGLSVDGVCGGLVTLDLAGFDSGARVAIVTGSGAGTTPVPGGLCAGTPLGVADPLLLRRVVTMDGDGALMLEVSVPLGACGSSVQAIDMARCTMSPAQPL
jgi:hypothetical protein